MSTKKKERTKNLRKRFKESELKAAVVHWDGKLLPTGTDKHMVERLSIIITSGDTEKILEVPKLQGTTGKELATAIYETLEDWGLTEIVKAMCCDTTSVHLGLKNGASILLQEMLQ